jgi:hypothetical protein
MSTTTSFSIKQGQALHLALQITQDDGTPVDITGAEIFSEIRDAYGNLVATPMLSVTNATLGQLTYRALSDETWPVGRLRTDIYCGLGGRTFFTQTTFIQVSCPVTQTADMT